MGVGAAGVKPTALRAGQPVFGLHLCQFRLSESTCRECVAALRVPIVAAATGVAASADAKAAQITTRRNVAKTYIGRPLWLKPSVSVFRKAMTSSISAGERAGTSPTWRLYGTSAMLTFAVYAAGKSSNLRT